MAGYTDPELPDFTSQRAARKPNPWLRSDPNWFNGILAQLYELSHKGAEAADPYTIGPNFGLPKSQTKQALSPPQTAPHPATALPLSSDLVRLLQNGQ